MPKERRTQHIKNPKQYEALREQGMSKQKSARIANSGRAASVKGGKRPKYEKWTKEELMQKAREVGIENFSTMNKSELIFALRNN